MLNVLAVGDSLDKGESIRGVGGRRQDASRRSERNVLQFLALRQGERAIESGAVKGIDCKTSLV